MAEALGRTNAAVERLGAAIDRLEAAAAQSGAGDLMLAGELRDARDQYAALQDTARMVSQRLDVAAQRVRGLLEE